MPIPKGWKKFVKDYRSDGQFQYFPHSKISNEHFAEKLRIISNFQGQPWNDATVMAAIRDAKLSKGESPAGVRMLRAAAENIGFCWFEDHILTVTEAGFAFIEGTDRAALLDRQLWRYKLPNPVNDGANSFTLFPHQALVRILCIVEGHRISRNEFILFVGRVRDDKAVDDAIAQIASWRKLDHETQDELIAALPNAEVRKRQTDSSYVLGFHEAASYLERFQDERGQKGIKIRDGERPNLLKSLKTSDISIPPLAKSASDFVAFSGGSEAAVDPLANLDHLLDTSRWNEAIATFRKLPSNLRGGRTPKQFEEEVFLERDLEQYLEKNLHKIEHGLTLVSAQYPLEAGVIDLLATSVKGDFVVIELKKVRASDKVFGQLCRYIGCLRERPESKDRNVRGYIIGSEIDVKLRYAAKVAPKGVVQLKRFRRDTASSDIFVED